MGMCGGGGGGGTTISKTEPPDYVKPYSLKAMDRAGTLADKPYEAYGGQRVAGLTDQHQAGIDMTTQRAMSGSPVLQQAQNSAQGTLAGQYLGYSPGGNPYMGQRTRIAQNPMAGMDNPYLQDAINRAQGETVRNYNLTTKPQWDTAMQQSGSFGNSGVDEMARNSQRDLMGQLGGIATNMRMQDYGMQQQLAEQQANRAQGVFSADMARNAQMGESGLDRSQNAYLAERGNMLQSQGQAPELANADYRDLQALLGIGDTLRDYNQSNLDQGYADWERQQQYPYQQLDVLQNAIRSAMGGGGTNVTSSQRTAGNSRFANALGGGAAGYAVGDMVGGYGGYGAAAGGLAGLLG